jgi:hypothetical protein
MEAPEALFVDVLDVQHKGRITEFKVDSMFVEVCEPWSLRVVSVVPDKPVSIGVVKDWDKKGTFQLRTDFETDANVTVMIHGIRKGFMGRRFKEMTEADYKNNLKKWGGPNAG